MTAFLKTDSFGLTEEVYLGYCERCDKELPHNQIHTHPLETDEETEYIKQYMKEYALSRKVNPSKVAARCNKRGKPIKQEIKDEVEIWNQ